MASCVCRKTETRHIPREKPTAKESKPASKKLSQIEAAIQILGKSKDTMNCIAMTVFGGKFTFQTINTLLRNPVYAGTLRVGHYARGKFSRVAENGIIEIENAVSTTTLRYSDASL